jgi:RNA polymerase sigma-70 factor (ECF subfamily)
VAEPPAWDLGRYRPLLRVQAEMLRLDQRILVRFDYSDLVNEALLRAHQQLGQFRGTTEAEFIAWLQRILENRAIDMIRDGQAQKRDVQRERSIEAAVKESSVRLDRLLASPETSPSERVQKEEQLVRMTRALDGLEQDQRQAVIARHLVGLKVAEIAAQMGRTEKAVAGLLLRGRRKLRQLLGESSDKVAGGGSDERAR